MVMSLFLRCHQERQVSVVVSLVRGEGWETCHRTKLEVKHISVQFEIVVSWAGVRAILAPDFFPGMKGDYMDLQGELTKKMFGADRTFEWSKCFIPLSIGVW